MKTIKFFGGKMLLLILIVGAAVGLNFAQETKASNRKLRSDIERLTREIKQTASGAYLVRFSPNAEKTGLLFTTKKTLWTKLSEAEQIRVAEDWWRRWLVIRGAADDQVNFMTNAGEGIFCIQDRCYVPECAL